MILAQVFEQSGELLELQAFARIHQERGSREVALPRGMQFGKNGDELDRKIVHAVKAHVLEGSQDRAFSGTGEPGEDNELPGVMSRVRLHGRRRSALFPALMRARDSHVFAVLRNGAARDVNSPV